PSRTMQPLVGHLCQPSTDVGVAGGRIEPQSSLFERSGQWHAKAALQIAIEALDLPLGLSAIGLANARGKTELLCDSQQPVVPTVVPLSICVTLDNDGASVIEQHVLRHAPEIDKGLSQ